MMTERNKLDPRTQALFERIEAIRQPAPTPEACSGDAKALRAVIDSMGPAQAHIVQHVALLAIHACRSDRLRHPGTLPLWGRAYEVLIDPRTEMSQRLLELDEVLARIEAMTPEVTP